MIVCEGVNMLMIVDVFVVFKEYDVYLGLSKVVNVGGVVIS